MIRQQIKQYNDMVYESGPIKFNDFIHNNPNKIHVQLYNCALKKFITEYSLCHLVYNLNIFPKSNDFDYITSEEFLQQYCKTNLFYWSLNNETVYVDYKPNKYSLLQLKELAQISYRHIQSVNGSFDHIIKNIDTNIIINKDYKVNNNGYEYHHYELFPNYNPDLYKYINTENNQSFDLSKFLNDAIESFMNNVYIIERYGEEYWLPSQIVIFHNGERLIDSNKNTYDNIISQLNIIKQTVDLSNWWNHTQDKNKYKPENIKIKQDNFTKPEVKYLDYIRGKAEFQDKSEAGYSFKGDFDVINEDTEISDEYLLNELFKTKLSS